MKNNWTILGLIVIAGVVFGVCVVPWLHNMGRSWVAGIVYTVLLLAFLYSRQDRSVAHGPEFRRRARRSPDQL